MKGYLYILSGPSSSGKTTLLNDLCKQPTGEALGTVKAPKYSTREERGPDDDVTQVFDAEGRPFVALGTGPFFDRCGNPVNVGPSGIDIAYAINKERYGLSTGRLSELLEEGKNVLVILSDFRIVRRLRRHFPANSKAVYIASAVDPKKLEVEQTLRLGITEEKRRELAAQITRLKAAERLHLWDRVAECIGELNDYWKKFKPGGESTDIRAERIRAFHTRYVDLLTLFDHVILNYTEGAPEEMSRQMKNVIASSAKHQAFHRAKQYPPILIVAAASGAGKGTMMEMLGLVGTDSVRLTSKLAKRNKKMNDKRDGMLAIGKPGEPPYEWPEWPDWWTEEMISCARSGRFPPEYDLQWVFHKQQDGKAAGKGIQYAVSSHEIAENIRKGLPQILISNMDQFERFREIYGNRAVFLYVYRLASAQDTEGWYLSVNPDQADARARIEEIRRVHESYMERIAEFDHVLLNTTHQEDLYDQIFHLLEYYHEIGEREELEQVAKPTPSTARLSITLGSRETHGE